MRVMRKLFNMVEVTLAMAVVGLGVTAVMALFPVAIQASRDAVGDSFASLAADKFIHFYAGSATAAKTSGTDEYVNWNSYIKDIASVSTNLEPVSSATIDSVTISDWTSTKATGIYKTTKSSRLFKVIKGDVARPDFDGTINIWFSEPVTYVFNGTNWMQWPKDGGINFTDYLVGINVEISWPNSKAYANREKRYFYLEVAKPKL
jgi:hypothetical protein